MQNATRWAHPGNDEQGRSHGSVDDGIKSLLLFFNELDSYQTIVTKWHGSIVISTIVVMIALSIFNLLKIQTAIINS